MPRQVSGTARRFASCRRFEQGVQTFLAFASCQLPRFTSLFIMHTPILAAGRVFWPELRPARVASVSFCVSTCFSSHPAVGRVAAPQELKQQFSAPSLLSLGTSNGFVVQRDASLAPSDGHCSPGPSVCEDSYESTTEDDEHVSRACSPSHSSTSCREPAQVCVAHPCSNLIL